MIKRFFSRLVLAGAVAAAAQAPGGAPAQVQVGAAARDAVYPFYMPMAGLRRPANRFFVVCDASRAAGHEVFRGRDAASLYGKAEGGYEFVYEAIDGAGRPCVYPFVPTLPQIVGRVDGTQWIVRSSMPGRRVVFRTHDDPWANVDFRVFDLGHNRVHFEMRDVELDFPGSIQPMGALHLEVPGGTRPGLFSAVLRRVKLFGGKNALFVPGGQTMLYIEDSEIAGNVGTEPDQQHSTYINGTLVSHFVNSIWYGQHAWKDAASGHQLKDKAYLRVYENLIVSNRPNGTTPSAMPVIDASAYGFTWANNLRLERVQPAQAARDGLVDLRTEILYGDRANYPWSVLANPGWRMPAAPLAALDKVYLSVFQNTTVRSYRAEPFMIALRPQGTGFAADGITVEGVAPPAMQRTVSLAFHTGGNLQRVYAPGGAVFVDPVLPAGAAWVKDRDAFIRHALGLIGR